MPEVYIYLKYNFIVWQPSSNQGCYKDEDEARIWPTSGTDPGKVLNLGTTNSPAK